MTALYGLTALAMVALGCGDNLSPDEEPDFPETYRTTYQEVRDCRLSLEHDLVYIRVYASPDAITPYADRQTPFPAGAQLLKEQYAGHDRTCAGDIEQTTVMTKLDVGASPKMLDWRWQTVSSDRSVVPVDLPRCASCHSMCGTPPDGYDGTCTLP
jgi:hypothetical protein